MESAQTNSSSQSFGQSYKRSKRTHPDRLKVLIWCFYDNLKKLRNELAIDKKLILRKRGVSSNKRVEVWCPCRNSAEQTFSTLKEKLKGKKIHVSLGKTFEERQKNKRQEADGKRNPLKKTEEVGILQWNARSLGNKISELKQEIETTKSRIICVQEASMTDNVSHQPKFKNFKLLNHSRQNRRGGGVATLVHDSLHIEKVSTYSTNNIEAITTEIHISKQQKFTLVNVYIPGQSITPNDLESITPKHTNYIIVGDFNARHSSWHKGTENQNGLPIYNWIQHEKMILLNKEKKPTYQSPSNGSLSTIDLSLASSNFAERIKGWSIRPDLGSDHFPVYMKICHTNVSLGKDPDPQTRYKIHSADWKCFREVADEFDFAHGDKLSNIEKAVTLAAEASIPKVKNRKERPMNIWWNAELTKLRKNRQKARRKWVRKRNGENRMAYNRANAVCKKAVLRAKRDSWKEFVNSINSNTPAQTAWKRFRSIDGNVSSKIISLKTADNHPLMNDLDKAEAFNIKYLKKSESSLVQPHNLTDMARYEDNADLLCLQQDRADACITMNELLRALTQTRKTAPGEDNIHNSMLVNLSGNLLQRILELFNEIWETGQIPATWKAATIIPILKPDKDASLLDSYRPIALTSCLGKLMERIINNRLVWRLENENRLQPNQFGFRPKNSTTDALLSLTNAIYKSFAEKGTTVAALIDLEAAFDKVPHYTIISKCIDLGIKGRMLTYLRSFLRSRMIKTKVNNAVSEPGTPQNGIPQGSVLSPTLFNIALYDLLNNIPTTADGCIFADDITIWSSDKDHMKAALNVQNALNAITSWTEKWGLTISTAKTESIAFTKKYSLKEFKPNLTIKGEVIGYNTHPRLLGVILYPKLLWREHIKKTNEICSGRLNLLKVVASRSWGADTLMLRKLYIAFIRSKMTYCSEIWSVAAETHKNKLNVIQNAALRLCLGCPKTTPIQAMEIELNVEPLDLLFKKIAWKKQIKLLSLPDENLLKKEMVKTPHYKQSYSYLISTLPISSLSDRPEVIPTVNPSAPWNFRPPNIRLDLVGDVNKRDLLEAQKAAALETISSRYKDYCRIYTDGSLIRSEEKSGAAFYVEETREVYLIPGNSNSSLDVELLAIDAALTFARSLNKTKVCILSDSMAALQVMQQYHPTDYFFRVVNIMRLLEKLRHKEIWFQWIPSHCDLLCNDLADRSAKAAAEMGPIPRAIRSLSSCLAQCDSAVRDEWITRWNNATSGRHLHSIQKIPNDLCNYKNVPREVATFASRARSGHIVTNAYLYRFNLTESPMCGICQGEEETLSHILLHCPGRNTARDKLKEELGDNCDIHKVLNSKDLWNLAAIVYARHRVVGINQDARDT